MLGHLLHGVFELFPLLPAAEDHGGGLLQGDPGLLPLGSALQHQDELALGLRDLVVGHRFAQGHAQGLLVELGELPAEGEAAVRVEGVPEVRKGGAELVGGLMEEHGAFLRLEGGQALPALLLIHGEEAFKAEAARGEAGDRQGVDGGAAAGDGDDRHAVFRAEPHETLPGVGDGGGAGVRHQGAALSRQEALQNGLARRRPGCAHGS